MAKSEQTWFVYLIRCANQSLYTGITIDPKRRFEEHQNSPKGAKYLRGKGPLTLVYQCQVPNRRSAHLCEMKIKKWPKSKKEALVAGRLPLPAL